MHPYLEGLIKEYLIPLYTIENEHPNFFLIKPIDSLNTKKFVFYFETGGLKSKILF